jgi:hypothetical protein
MATEVEQWTANERRDGLRVRQGVDGWIIMPGGKAPPVSLCPCCDLPFKSALAARRVAGFLYPVEGPLDAA